MEECSLIEVPGWNEVEVSNLFRGRFDCKIDAKGRLSLPASLRKELGENTDFVVTNSLYQGRRCLDLYLLSTWEKLEQKIQAMPSLKAEVQAYQRFYMSGGQVINKDSQNRILMPGSLRSYASLSDELMLVGMGHKIEIWSVDVWNEIYENLATQFESIQNVVSGFEAGDL